MADDHSRYHTRSDASVATVPAADDTSTLCEALRSPIRRYLLRELRGTDDPVSVPGLAAKVAAWKSETPVSELDEETRQRIHTLLYHVHLPKLADIGLVEYRPDQQIVTFDGGSDALDSVFAVDGGDGAGE